MEIQDSNLVILFKSETGENSDPYMKILKRHGYQSHCIPILDFNFINLDLYGQLLKNLQKYLAIVFTSPRAVQATELVLNAIGIPLCSIQSVKCYTVGKATALAAKNLGFHTCGESTGSAEFLARYIVQVWFEKLCTQEIGLEREKRCGMDSEDAGNREVLFPCGNLCRDVLCDTLEAHNFHITEVKVYETVAKEDVSNELYVITQSKVPIDSMVMFSPSGVPVLTSTLRKFPQLLVDSVKILAVGPTTESELQKHNLPVYATLRRPDPESLIDCLRK
ncbi:uroporphyrinogen-III synthase-like isoform X1 [Ostrea edulis]|uniref:uroporphyrinogen-III synthase-like isoform X1 n=1 Tax=Ostrea edulis TaxID=37623 RepID=UPI0024AFDACE|nr:uroporphyrinogen-III synthase-like isoform X1 [Ostrea edulis]XP_056005001.1 uroporphyrinogen-III synthase-like isoform X1 [Ostrea edulis]